MLSIRYRTSVSYKDVFGDENRKVYELFARNDEDARSITSEIFLLDEGVSEDMEINVTPLKPPAEVESRIDRSLVDVLRELNKLVSGANYKDFMSMYLKLGGKNLKLGSNASFMLEFLGFTFALQMKNGTPEINRTEIRYTDANNHKYVIRYGEVFYAN